MNCTGCGKAISGAYEAGSYSCSGCGAGVEVNPSTSGDKTPMPRISVMKSSIGWEQSQQEMLETRCVHCPNKATTTAYGKFQQVREEISRFIERDVEGWHWCCDVHQGLHAYAKSISWIILDGVSRLTANSFFTSESRFSISTVSVPKPSDVGSSIDSRLNLKTNGGCSGAWPGVSRLLAVCICGSRATRKT